jgi:PRTRC genetic system protein A
MPMFGPLDPLTAGQRMVVGRNGLFLQIRTPWLDCTTMVAPTATGLALPYGQVLESMQFEFGVIPLQLLERFVELAREAMPNEAAGALIFDTRNGALTLRMHEAIDAGPEHINYRIADLRDHEVLAIDLHTHARLAAFWSSNDDQDDTGVRVCGVFGNLDHPRPSAKFRLVLNGLFRELPNPWEAKSGVGVD